MTRYRGILIFSILMALVLPPASMAGEDPLPESTRFITDFQWITFGSGITQYTTGFQFSHNLWYTELTCGGFSAFDNREASFYLGLNFGRRFPLKSWLYVAADVGLRHVLPSGTDNPTINTEKFYTLDGRLRLEAVLGRYMTCFVGASTTNIYEGDSFSSVDTNKGSVFWGVGLF